MNNCGNSPLAVLGHDGGSTAFAPGRNAYVESLGRTWFISESNPARGGVLSFSFEMAANDNKRYALYRKAAGETDYSVCSEDFVKTGTGVSFTLTKLYSGRAAVPHGHEVAASQVTPSPASLSFSPLRRPRDSGTISMSAARWRRPGGRCGIFAKAGRCARAHGPAKTETL